jgi:acyl transferase domain-containing protein/short-subunit dehydrogenase/acyl carrier protein
MAAIQLAGHLGAEVFATASPGKWPALRSLGVADDHIASSRSAEFEGAFRAVTGGRGVDVVLNSLTGELTDASLRLLADGGQFIEMGKADIRIPQQVAEAHPGVAYQTLDLTDAGWDNIGRMLSELMRLFAAGVLRPLPVTAWDIRRAPEAFRFISQARHTGKVVLTMPPRLAGPGIPWSGPVLVTGGTGTLGAVLSRHLAAGHGVSDLVLISRQGPGAQGAGKLAAELAGAGAQVRVAVCDVADRAALAGLLSWVGHQGRPVAGVVHCAGALDDGAIRSLTAQRFDAVLAPKADAAWHLHELTAGMDLGMFALYSSTSGTLGGPGQGNYAAGNAFLDGLAAWRRAQGLAAVSLAWGFWEQASGLTSHLGERDLARLRRAGIVPMTSAEGMELFDAGMASPAPAVVAARLDAAALAAQARVRTLPVLLADLVRGAAAPSALAEGGSLVGRLAGLDGDGRRRLVLEIVRGQAAAVLGHGGPDGVMADRAFRDLGFDSLTAVELRNRLSGVTGLRLPATVVFDYPSPASLAARLLAELRPGETPARVASTPAASDVDTPAASDEELIAVVGIGCRFPGGAGSAEELWELVAGGVDAVGDFPVDRGWDAAGGSYARRGGFVYDAAGFDAGFFGISPREAVAMDPQQRLLLECAWEAFEDAGIDPVSLRGSGTGVFAGVISQDYGLRSSDGDGGAGGGFGMTGAMASVASGRVSYVFGLEGPAVSVDTACSSSLVALHLAGQALRRGECSLALAGGVAVMATPAGFIEFSRQQGLAADGRCKAFSAAADGTGWGEGAGLLVVERLSDAVANGHRVLGVVAGSAVNQDGASNGLTAPNGPSQERVIRAALADAGIGPSDVDVVEAHGTGTVLGDPIEAGALLAAYGRGRPADRPLWLGSVKSNIGHAQAAAGVAGVIKVLMALRHERMPATLHVDVPSRHVDWESGGVRLLARAREWPAEPGRVRRAGVSSFGISGTNAHVIIEEPPPLSAVPAERSAGVLGGGVVAWPVSAKTPAALAAQAARLAVFLGGRPDLDPGAVAAGLGRRGVFAHRAVVTGAGRDGLVAGLAALAAGEPAVGLVSGRAAAEPGKVAFVFPGQGSQQPGAGAELYAASPVFAASVEEVCELFGGVLERPLRDVMFAVPGSGLAGLFDQTCYAQAGIFAVEVALARMLDRLGIRPALAAGHSVGEVTAAYVAGVMTLPDAVRLVAARGRLMQALPPGGAMIAVQAGEEEVAALLAGREDRAVVAAVNGPASVVISGQEAVVAEVAGQLAARGRRTRRLRVSHAFHSPLMEPMLGEFAVQAARVEYAVPRVPLVSGVTGRLAAGTEMCCAQYWVENVRRAVRFGDAVLALRAAGAGIVAEVGPGQALSGIARDCLDEDGHIVAGPVLRRGRPEPLAVAGLAAEVFVRGGGVDWPVPCVPWAGLPGYAFQRERFWQARPAADVGSAGLVAGGHPLVAAVAELADGQGWVLSGRLAAGAEGWLADHVIGGIAVVPGVAVAELVVRAGDVAGCGWVAELVMEAPLLVPAEGGVVIQVRVGAAEPDGRRPAGVYSRAEDEFGQWRRHATGMLASGPVPVRDAGEFAVWPPPGAVPVPVGDLYARLADAGAPYGPSFLGLRAGWRRGDEMFAEVALPAGTDAGQWAIHPALLDAALHARALQEGGELRVAVPFSWTGVSLHASGPSLLRVRIGAIAADRFSVTCADGAGTVVFSAESLVVRPLTDGWSAGRGGAGVLLKLEWEPAPAVPGAADTAGWAVLGERELPAPLAGLPRSGDAAALAAVVPAPPVVLVAAGQAWDGAHEAAGDQTRRVRLAAGRALRVVQEWLDREELSGSRLVVLTRGAVPVPGEAPGDLAGAAVWGLIRSVQSEHPGRVVLADVDDAGGSLAALAVVLDLGEPQAVIRGGRVLLPRLERAGAPDPVPAPRLDGGPVLVTGGTGTLGGLVARHLAAVHGARDITLISRHGPAAPGAAALAADLAAGGAAARVTACDAADRDALAAVLAQAQRRGPLAGVVHCAGATDDGAIASLTPARLDRVLAAKADAAWHLHELTAGLNLKVFALFSSASGILGAPGQGNYAAANAFLDALAARRRAQGLPGISLAWGLWEPASTMTATFTQADRARIARSGMRALTAQDALALFDTALTAGQPLLIPLSIDTAALRTHTTTTPPLLTRLRAELAGEQPTPAVRTAPGSAASERAAAERLRARLAGLSGEERSKALLDLVRRDASEVLGHADQAAVPPDQAFSEQGFDSLTSVELRNRLTAATGLRLPATLVFDYPTAHALSQYLDESMPRDDVPSAAPVLDALDRLAQALAGIAADHPEHARITRRLRAVAAGWTDRSAAGDDAQYQAGPDDDGPGDRGRLSLETADDEAVFDFLTNELGIA